MLHTFEARTANEAWLQAADALRDKATEQESRNGPTKELLHVLMSIEDPMQRWVTSRRPAINPAFALAEVIWIMTGRQDAAFLTYFNRQLAKYVGNCTVLHGAYGHRLRVHLGIDQLERCYRALMAKPESRQVVLQLWDGRIDLPDDDGMEQSSDIPCNVVAMLKVRSNRLEWTQIMRSNDIYRGLPYNIVQFTSLQEIMAGWLNLVPGAYQHFSDSLHVYQDGVASLVGVVEEAAENSDSLLLSKKESEMAFSYLAGQVQQLLEGNLTGKTILAAVREAELTPAYVNILRVLYAEAARRSRWLGVDEELMAECTNKAYLHLWKQWVARFKRVDNIDQKDDV